MAIKKKPSTRVKAIARIRRAVKKRSLYTEKENARFAALPPAKQRVQIARDVLVQIGAERIKPTAGVYLHNTDKKAARVTTKQGNKEISEVFADMKSCDACALGSIFVCTVDRADKLKVKDLLYDKFSGFPTPASGEKVDITLRTSQHSMHQYLKPFFDSDQLHMIEAAFEVNTNREGGMFNVLKGGRYIHLKNLTLRLERILRNIIRHKGMFYPGDEKDENSLKKLLNQQIKREAGARKYYFKA